MSENKKTNQIQPPEEIVLCGASAYNQKFYINENFKNLPDEIKNQLKVMCVLFCADIGGILQLVLVILRVFGSTLKMASRKSINERIDAIIL